MGATVFKVSDFNKTKKDDGDQPEICGEPLVHFYEEPVSREDSILTQLLHDNFSYVMVLISVLVISFEMCLKEYWLFHAGICVLIMFGFWALDKRVSKTNDIDTNRDMDRDRRDVDRDTALKAFINDKFNSISLSNNSNINNGHNNCILLDTNVLMDSRIIDLIIEPLFKNRFYIPRFVLEELLTLSNSEANIFATHAKDAIISIKAIMEANNINIIDIPRNKEMDVDVQLIELAANLNAVIFTKDSALANKAVKKGILVSSIDDLAESLETPYGIKEVFEIKIVKRGKDRNEGVGYFRDGSMVVVDDTGDKIGQTVLIKIDSMLRNVKGKVFFASVETEEGN